MANFRGLIHDGTLKSGRRRDPRSNATVLQDIRFRRDRAGSEYVRLQFEYARRDSDRVVDIPLPLRVTDAVHGYYGEAEFLLYKNVRAVHFLTRYDLQQQVSATRPVNSSVGLNNFFVSRFTYGLNFTFANSSTLMLNHEYWMLPSNLGRVNVFGVRWSYSFSASHSGRHDLSR